MSILPSCSGSGSSRVTSNPLLSVLRQEPFCLLAYLANYHVLWFPVSALITIPPSLNDGVDPNNAQKRLWAQVSGTGKEQAFVGPLGTSLGMGQLQPYHSTASGPEDQDCCCRPGPHGCQSKWRGIVLAMDGWPEDMP